MDFRWSTILLGRAILLAAACVFACPFVLAKSPTVTSHQPKTVECWEIIQDNQSFGTIKMSLAPQGARVEIQNLHVSVVCKPPTWRVSVFNPVSKQELSSSIEQWGHAPHSKPRLPEKAKLHCPIFPTRKTSNK
jgi:hypothetical protein